MQIDSTKKTGPAPDMHPQNSEKYVAHDKFSNSPSLCFHIFEIILWYKNVRVIFLLHKRNNSDNACSCPCLQSIFVNKLNFHQFKSYHFKSLMAGFPFWCSLGSSLPAKVATSVGTLRISQLLSVYYVTCGSRYVLS